MRYLMVEVFVFPKDNVVWLYFSQIILKPKSCIYVKNYLSSNGSYYSFNRYILINSFFNFLKETKYWTIIKKQNSRESFQKSAYLFFDYPEWVN